MLRACPTDTVPADSADVDDFESLPDFFAAEGVLAALPDVAGATWTAAAFFSTFGSFGSVDASMVGRAVAGLVDWVVVDSLVVDSETASGVGVTVLPAATSWMVEESGWLLDAALMTATLATDPATSIPPAAMTVAMMLDRCMVLLLAWMRWVVLASP
jgi:hypothetical protein